MPGAYAGLGDVAAGFMQGLDISSRFAEQGRREDAATFERNVKKSALYLQGVGIVSGDPALAGSVNKSLAPFGMSVDPEVAQAGQAVRASAARLHAIILSGGEADPKTIADLASDPHLYGVLHGDKSGSMLKILGDIGQRNKNLGLAAKLNLDVTSYMAQHGVDRTTATQEVSAANPHYLDIFKGVKETFPPQLSAEHQLTERNRPVIEGIAAMRGQPGVSDAAVIARIGNIPGGKDWLAQQPWYKGAVSGAEAGGKVAGEEGAYAGPMPDLGAAAGAAPWAGVPSQTGPGVAPPAPVPTLGQKRATRLGLEAQTKVTDVQRQTAAASTLRAETGVKAHELNVQKAQETAVWREHVADSLKTMEGKAIDTANRLFPPDQFPLENQVFAEYLRGRMGFLSALANQEKTPEQIMADMTAEVARLRGETPPVGGDDAKQEAQGFLSRWLSDLLGRPKKKAAPAEGGRMPRGRTGTATPEPPPPIGLRQPKPGATPPAPSAPPTSAQTPTPVSQLSPEQQAGLRQARDATLTALFPGVTWQMATPEQKAAVSRRLSGGE